MNNEQELKALEALFIEAEPELQAVAAKYGFTLKLTDEDGTLFFFPQVEENWEPDPAIDITSPMRGIVMGRILEMQKKDNFTHKAWEHYYVDPESKTLVFMSKSRKNLITLFKTSAITWKDFSDRNLLNACEALSNHYVKSL
jgi:hypothetical protein